MKYNRKKLREWHSSDSSDDMEKMALLIEIGMIPYIGECCHSMSAKFMLALLPTLLLTLLQMHVSMFYDR